MKWVFKPPVVDGHIPRGGPWDPSGQSRNSLPSVQTWHISVHEGMKGGNQHCSRGWDSGDTQVSAESSQHSVGDLLDSYTYLFEVPFFLSGSTDLDLSLLEWGKYLLTDLLHPCSGDAGWVGWRSRGLLVTWILCFSETSVSDIRENQALGLKEKQWITNWTWVHMQFVLDLSLWLAGTGSRNSNTVWIFQDETSKASSEVSLSLSNTALSSWACYGYVLKQLRNVRAMCLEQQKEFVLVRLGQVSLTKWAENTET